MAYTITVRRGALFLDEVANESSTPTTDSEFKYVSISGVSKYTLPDDAGKSVTATIKQKYLAVKDWGLTTGYGKFGEITWSGNTSATYTFAYDKAYDGKTLYLYIWLRWYRYNLTFDSNGGASISSMSNISCADGGYVTLPDVSRTGYTFNGWAKPTAGSNLSGRVGAEDIGVSSDGQTIKLTAKWTANKYTVSYDSNGGSSYADTTVTYGSTYGSAIFTPVRTGYTFDGWFTEREGGTKVESTTTVEITSAQTLYAHWTANKYTVSYDSNGGSQHADTTVTYGSTYDTLPTPTREGYTFDGWYTALSGGTKITSSTPVEITDKQTLYARWTAKTYTVSFNANGGSVSPTSTTVTYGSTYDTLPTPTREGYTFDGWYTASSGGALITSSTIVKLTSAQTLYAHWTAKTYTVALNANGGTGGGGQFSVNYGSKANNIAAGSLPKRTGYSFSGYYTAKSGGTQYFNSNGECIKNWSETSVSTLYAHWAANQYTVTFDANGGSPTTASKRVTYDSTYGNLPDATRTGYTFDGWYTASSGGALITSSTIVSTPTNHILYAHWKGDSHTVTFDYNGVEPTGITSMTVTYGSLYSANSEGYDSLPTPIRAGYTFGGWYTEDGTKISIESTVSINDSHILYAYWIGNKIKITLNPGEGTVLGDATKEVTVGRLYGDLPDAERDNYYFTGWFLDGGKITSTTIVNVTDDHELVAGWTLSSVTVSFEGNSPDGSLVAVNGVDGSVDVSPGKHYSDFFQSGMPTASCTGYTFDGWYTAAIDGDKITVDSDVIADNHTLYAHWTANTYKLILTDACEKGTLGTIELDCTYNESYVLPVQGGLRHGYTFGGWSNSGGGEMAYVDGATVKNLSSIQDDTVYLYGIWAANKSSVLVYAKNAVRSGIISVEKYTDILSSDPLPERVEEVDGGWKLHYEKDPTVKFTVTHDGGVTDGDGTGSLKGYVFVRAEDITDAGKTVLAPNEDGNYSWEREVNGDFVYQVSWRQIFNASARYWDGQNNSMGTVSINGDELQGAVYQKVYVQDGASIEYSAKSNLGYVFDGWYASMDDDELYATASSISVTISSDFTLYAKFRQDPNGIYEWEGSDKRKVMSWKSKSFSSSTPIAFGACRIDATGYPPDYPMKFSVKAFSSPDEEPTSQITISNLGSQQARRIPMYRKEKFTQFAVEGSVKINTITVSTSMGGLAV